ncbi:SusC/RagA family [Proteiniphilum saccharofermentans]|uniref:SusC/RagA family n=1 Tax=Proteiniphilum saccharofermentans TaxID=1642647 RepID=A0A1R3T5M9_9BACT|nr:TonB-dependent receptor [Proteiniphilum saccharofermentans]SCD19887.1 SusC/RagA family [Proteiniphilum saccharofermentans]
MKQVKFGFRRKRIQIIVMICSVQLFSLWESNAQAITIHQTDKSVREIIRVIEATSDMVFFYNNKDIDLNRKVTLKVSNESIKNVLDLLFAGTQSTYKIDGRQIYIMKKPGEKENAVLQQKKTVTITGTIVDKSGESIIGANIVEKGTTNGTVTDVNGNFSLQVEEGATLHVSYIGYLSQDINTAGKTRFEIVLQEDTQALDELVVVGYGVMRKSDVTGSIAQIRSEEINNYPSTNIMQALSGKSPGVQVMQNSGAPGATMSIRIRGANSIQGSNEPLYVIDGFPIANQTILNNSDIESIEILKDASATAIYGSRGANGVVLITTKQGRAGAAIVDLETSYSLQSIISRMDLMNAQEYATFYNIQQLNDTGKEYFTSDQIQNFGIGTDWQSLAFRQAPLLTTSLNVSGGNEKTRYSISGSVFNQEGIIEGSNYDRYSIRTNIDHELSKYFGITLSSTLSRLDTERKDSGGGSRGTSLIGSTLAAAPTLSPYTENGDYTTLAIAYPFVATDIINPLNFIYETSSHIKANIALVNAALEFKPIQNVLVKISGGVENRDDRTDNYTTTNYFRSTGSASVSATQYTSLLNENTISYINTFKDIHHLSAVAGFTYQDFLNTSLSGSSSGFLSNDFQSYNLAAGENPGIPGSNYTKSLLLSYLGRINYNLDNKYLLTVSFRADGSSRFSAGNKWGYFPSTALAWRISEEEFLKDNAVVSNLKFRTSWGMTGSQAISPYVTLNQLSSDKVVFDDALNATFAPTNRLPGNLKWETTSQLNAGIDLGIWNNRLNLVADYYIKDTRDLLNTVRLPSSLGWTNTIQNVGKVQNKGFELGLDALLLEGPFYWNVNTNISFNRNRVLKLYNGEDILGPTSGALSLSGNVNILREGQPIGIFYGYKEDGYDEDGFIKYKDLNGDGAFNQEDRTYIGNPNPDFIYGLRSDMSWKNFELSLFLQGSYGNDLLNISKMSYAYDYGFGLNMIKDVLNNHWSENNPTAKYPKISYYTKYQMSDRFVEDGSYLRVKNIQLTYKLPLNKLKADWMKALQIYVSAQNLLTFTNYSGWDPEVNARGGSNSTILGIDDNVYPNSKTFTFGLRAQF